MQDFQYATKDGGVKTFQAADSNAALAALKGFSDADPTSGVGLVAPTATPTTQADKVSSGGTPSPFSVDVPDVADPAALAFTGTLQDLTARSQKMEQDAMAQRIEAQNREKQLQDELLAKMKMTPEEQAAQMKLNEVTQKIREKEVAVRRAIETLTYQGNPVGVGAVGDMTNAVERQARFQMADLALQQLAASDTLKALTGFRESNIKILSTALGFESDRVERLLGLESEFRQETRELSKEQRSNLREDLLRTVDMGLKYGVSFDELSQKDQDALANWAASTPGMSLSMLAKSMEAGKIAYEEQRTKAALELEKMRADIANTKSITNERNENMSTPTVSDSVADATLILANTPKGDLTAKKAELIEKTLGSEIPPAEKEQIIKAINDYGVTPTVQSAPVSAYGVGKSIANSPAYQALHPENLITGAGKVAGGIGNFFKGFAGF
jgi:hypothetical protein